MLGKVLVYDVCWFSSGNQSPKYPVKFQITLFSGRYVGGAQSSTIRAQNISTNISSLGKRRPKLKLGEVPTLPISYNITIS